MKFPKTLTALLLATLLAIGASSAESYLTASCEGGMIYISWCAEDASQLTLYRNGWPVSVCRVDGESRGTSLPLPKQAGTYSVRLMTGEGCLQANVEGCGTQDAATTEPTKEPAVTAEPTIEPTEEPVSTTEPVVVPTKQPVPTAAPTNEPTKAPVVTAEPTVAPTKQPVVTAAPTALPTTGGGGQTSSSLAAQVISQVNSERAKYGLSALTEDARLSEAACIRAQEIVRQFSHTRPDGSAWSTVSSYAYGENIAKGHNSVDRVMAAWMSSEGHRANILRESFGSIGVCTLEVDGVMYWVQLFGR